MLRLARVDVCTEHVVVVAAEADRLVCAPHELLEPVLARKVAAQLQCRTERRQRLEERELRRRHVGVCDRIALEEELRERAHVVHNRRDLGQRIVA